jgi:hypothetical protein
MGADLLGMSQRLDILKAATIRPGARGTYKGSRPARLVRPPGRAGESSTPLRCRERICGEMTAHRGRRRRLAVGPGWRLRRYADLWQVASAPQQPPRSNVAPLRRHRFTSSLRHRRKEEP